MTRQIRSLWVQEVVSAADKALRPLADKKKASGAFAYMKEIAPFLGVSAPDRRRALKSAWQDLPEPTSDELGQACLALMNCKEREFHYAAADLLDKYRHVCNAKFLKTYGADLLSTTSWWDSVDALVTSMVSPLTRRFPERTLMKSWSNSNDRWLIRAAIGHQRGWKNETDIEYALSFCDQHWDNKEFFIAKAIGWSLRDLARLDAKLVRSFLAKHHDKNRVAIREAQRVLGK